MQAGANSDAGAAKLWIASLWGFGTLPAISTSKAHERASTPGRDGLEAYYTPRYSSWEKTERMGLARRAKFMHDETVFPRRSLRILRSPPTQNSPWLSPKKSSPVYTRPMSTPTMQKPCAFSNLRVVPSAMGFVGSNKGHSNPPYGSNDKVANSTSLPDWSWSIQ